MLQKNASALIQTAELEAIKKYVIVAYNRVLNVQQNFTKMYDGMTFLM